MTMREIPDPYRLLGVRRDATLEEIKAAHRRLAKRYHPDAPKGDTRRFLAVQEAYQVLSDPLRRRSWDSSHPQGPVRADDPLRRPGTPGRPGAARPRTPPRGPGRPGDPARPADAGRTADPTRPRPRPAGADARQPEPPPPPGWGSHQDPGTRSYTWSARDVPWWEDAATNAARARTDGPASRGGASAKDARAGASGPARPADPAGPAREQPRASGGARPDATATGATAPDEPTTDHVAAEQDVAPRGTADFDVYSRSSGAAWSAASRAYFRRATADTPGRSARAGSWVNPPPGTRAREQARRAAEDAARARTAPPTPDAAAPRAPAAPPPRTRPATPPTDAARAAARETRAPGPASSTWTASGAGAHAPPFAPRDAHSGTWTGRTRPAPAASHAAAATAPLRSAWTVARAANGWPSTPDRLVFATLGWIPIALAVAWLLTEITGCGAASTRCSALVVPGQVGVAGLALFALAALPRLAYYTAMGALGLAAVAAALASVYAVLGLAQPIPAPLLTLTLLVWAGGYVAGVLGATRDVPWTRPWLRYRSRRRP